MRKVEQPTPVPTPQPQPEPTPPQSQSKPTEKYTAVDALKALQASVGIIPNNKVKSNSPI